MARLLTILTASVLAIGLFGCGHSRIDTEAWSDRLSKAVLSVQGVTGGDVRMRMAGVSPQIHCDVTSSAGSRDELIAVLEAVIRRVLGETREIDNAMVYVSATNGADSIGKSDLGISSDTLEGLRKHFA